jgi:hypothetical protein
MVCRDSVDLWKGRNTAKRHIVNLPRGVKQRVGKRTNIVVRDGVVRLDGPCHYRCLLLGELVSGRGCDCAAEGASCSLIPNQEDLSERTTR